MHMLERLVLETNLQSNKLNQANTVTLKVGKVKVKSNSERETLYVLALEFIGDAFYLEQYKVTNINVDLMVLDKGHVDWNAYETLAKNVLVSIFMSKRSDLIKQQSLIVKQIFESMTFDDLIKDI